MTTLINVTHSLSTRTQSRESWEEDFEQNHEGFAHSLAGGIARRCLNELSVILGDPYITIPSQNGMFSKTFNLHILDSETANKIKGLYISMEGEGISIPSPFKEWIERSTSPERKQKVMYSSKVSFIKGRISNEDTDSDYFEELMSKVARCAESELKKIFGEVTSKPENRSLCIQVTCQRGNRLLSGSTAINGITIEAWVDKQVTSENETYTEQRSNGLGWLLKKMSK